MVKVELAPRRDLEGYRTILAVFGGPEQAQDALTAMHDSGLVLVLRADVVQPGRQVGETISDLLEADEGDWPRHHLAHGLTVVVVDVPAAHAWAVASFLVEIAQSHRSLMLVPRHARGRLDVWIYEEVPHAAG